MSDQKMFLKFLNIYKAYRKYGLSHKESRLNTLEDSEPYMSVQDRVRLSWLINSAY